MIALTGTELTQDGFKCCGHCINDLAYHRDNPANQHPVTCALCVAAINRQAARA